jgi:3-deoxy-D-manno-octulosonic-acid transferase
MTFSYFAYNFLGSAAASIMLPAIWGHCKRRRDDLDRFHQRLAFYPQELFALFEGRPRIWLHAVSVGEVGVADAIVNALRTTLPHCRIALSTTTRTGLAQARGLLDPKTTPFYAPLDLIGPTRKALEMVRPDVLAIVETEIWPNLIVAARRMGIRTALINGRISERTVRRYRQIVSLMRYTLGHVDAFSMISQADADRICSLGASRERVEVNGNAKFDMRDPVSRRDDRNWAQAVFNLDDVTPVLVAGSTRHPEEQIVIEAFRAIRQAEPRAVLIIAPRHIERSGQIEAWVRSRGWECQRRSRLANAGALRSAPVVILDTIGELAATYSVAHVVFCGGSLVPKGGQNLLEPAMWGKPILHGPSMEDFEEARRLIATAGGSRTVFSAEQIARETIDWLRRPEVAAKAGQSAREAILSHRGAARKHADGIVRLLDQGRRRRGGV